MSHPFWLLLSIACLVWYSTITIYVAVKGASDIVAMLKTLSPPEDADRAPTLAGRG